MAIINKSLRFITIYSTVPEIMENENTNNAWVVYGTNIRTLISDVNWL